MKTLRSLSLLTKLMIAYVAYTLYHSLYSKQFCLPHELNNTDTPFVYPPDLDPQFHNAYQALCDAFGAVWFSLFDSVRWLEDDSFEATITINNHQYTLDGSVGLYDDEDSPRLMINSRDDGWAFDLSNDRAQNYQHFAEGMYQLAKAFYGVYHLPLNQFVPAYYAEWLEQEAERTATFSKDVERACFAVLGGRWEPYIELIKAEFKKLTPFDSEPALTTTLCDDGVDWVINETSLHMFYCEEEQGPAIGITSNDDESVDSTMYYPLFCAQTAHEHLHQFLRAVHRLGALVS